MAPSIRCFSAFLLFAAAATVSSPTVSSLSSDAAAADHTAPLLPSNDAARRNAFAIFNAVHSAMRQWGSSLNHNGLSFFLATVPEGQLFYHGGRDPGRPRGLNGTGCEWLAFEVEHAQLFASSRYGRARRPDDGRTPGDEPAGGGGGGGGGDADDQIHISSSESEKTDNDESKGGRSPPPKTRTLARLPGDTRGYFHTYRAARPLNLLYIDGMGAGKTSYGCLDSQDYLLLDWPTDGSKHGGLMGSELDRATGLCDLAKAWAWDGGRIDGFIRTEAGFEIIYCDFGEGGGLDVVSIHASPFVNETGGLPGFSDVEYLRGVSLRYHGQPAGRLYVDWSSMVSAFFYDVNLTNPDASRPELPRLIGTPRAARRGIRARLGEVVAARHGVLAGHRPHHPMHINEDDAQYIDWQGTVDLIVTRFSARLHLLAHVEAAAVVSTAARMLHTLLNPYINYVVAGSDISSSSSSSSSSAAHNNDVQIARCTEHYLSAPRASASAWTPEDRAIYTAVETVTHAICSSLFAIRTVLYNKTDGATRDGDSNSNNNADEQHQSVAVRHIVGNLMAKLQWTTWRQCDPCPQPDELCLVAMFPWGDDEDHFHPRCKKTTDLSTRRNYWLNWVRNP
ncbi:hypothetical protein SPI_06539 [Niveomyces insectorum RCEF 264]|uniref:Uncharacterized protein n=1 Tax=Niveomyces insectorum RCEF 264 TaxID=1081102 RepID=A0A167RCK8_9HYPO|nr:hypothetical protein SPI_06539 [Niveomyces insectorum RCEF 264]